MDNRLLTAEDRLATLLGVDRMDMHIYDVDDPQLRGILYLEQLADLVERRIQAAEADPKTTATERRQYHQEQIDRLALADGQELSPHFGSLHIPISAVRQEGESLEGQTEFDGEATIQIDTWNAVLWLVDLEGQPPINWHIKFTPEQWEGMISFVEYAHAVEAIGPTEQWFEEAKNVTCPRCGLVVDFRKLDQSRYWTHGAISCPRCGRRTEIPSWIAGYAVQQSVTA
jgi:hypothetical protein